MREVMAGRTSIVIAHRLSTAEQAERVLVVNDGRIIEDGRHEELLQKNGYYSELYRHWSERSQPSGVS